MTKEMGDLVEYSGKTNKKTREFIVERQRKEKGRGHRWTPSKYEAIKQINPPLFPQKSKSINHVFVEPAIQSIN